MLHSKMFLSCMTKLFTKHFMGMGLVNQGTTTHSVSHKMLRKVGVAFTAAQAFIFVNAVIKGSAVSIDRRHLVNIIYILVIVDLCK